MADCTNNKMLQSSNLPESHYHLFELSSDLRQLFESHVDSDFVVYVGEKVIPCHKAILCARSKWFSYRIDEAVLAGLNSLTIEEDEKLVEAILFYIYSGDINLLESLKIPVFDLIYIAIKYGLKRLNKLMLLTINLNHYTQKKTEEFSWNFSMAEHKTTKINYSKEFIFTISDDWSVKVRPICFLEHKYHFKIILIRKSKPDTNDNVYVTNLEVTISNSEGLPQQTIRSSYLYWKEFKGMIQDSLPSSKNKERSNMLFHDDLIVFEGKLIIYSESLKSENRVIFELSNDQERSRVNEFHALSYDMYQMMKSARFCDTTILVKKIPPIQIHSYILSCRACIPYAGILKNLDMFEGFGSISCRSFINFLYSGQSIFLEDHMRLFYNFLSELRIDEAKEKYSKILGRNLTMSNVYDILRDATIYRDENLAKTAMAFIIRNSSEIVDHTSWNALACEYSELSRVVKKSARCKKTSEEKAE